MEILQLRYFVTVAKLQNMTAAAQELHISQPSLSASIKRLENELGYPLFDRKKGHLSLNTFGRYYLDIARRIINLIDTSRPTGVENQSGMVSIAFSNYDDYTLKHIRDFQIQNPNIHFNIHFGTMGESFSYSSYDFIVAHDRVFDSSGLNNIPLQGDCNYVVVPRYHPLASRTSLTLKDLENQPLCFLRNNAGTTEAEYYDCLNAGFVPRTVVVTDSPCIKLLLLSLGDMFGFIPSSWVSPYQQSRRVAILPLEDSECYTTRLYWSNQKDLETPAMLFLDYMRDKSFDEI